MDRKFVVLALAAAMCVGWLAPAQGADPNQYDYTLPAMEAFRSTGTLAGMVDAYQILNNGMTNPAVTGDKRQLILLHVVARTAMLVLDTGNVAVTTSLLEVVQPFGITITGDKFFPADPCDPDRIQLILPTNPADPNCLQLPPGADVNAAASAINTAILPQLDQILTELNQVTNSPAFIMILTPAQTGQPANIEVDYGDVLALKAQLLSIKTFLYAGADPAYDVTIDLMNSIFAGWQCGILPDTTTINTILNAYPNLLEVLATAGPAKLAQTKQNLLAALDAGIATLDTILAETDDQSNDLLMMEAEDRPSNIAIRAELFKFRTSVANGTAATYTLGSKQQFSLRQGGTAIGRMGLVYDPPVGEAGQGWFALSNPVDLPGWWNIDWFDINGSQIVGDASAGDALDWYTGWFEGTISADGSQITNMTFQWWTWGDGDTVTGLSAARTLNEPINMQFNPGPIFAGTVSPRDTLPQFDPNGEPIPSTMGHGLNNDATLGGIFPGLTQRDWFASGFEIWGGNTNYINEPGHWNRFYNIDLNGYTRLGQSSGGTLAVSGNYQYYVVATKGQTLVDSIRGSTGAYYSGSLATGNTENWENIAGAPDSHYATVGQRQDIAWLRTGPTFMGYVVVTNPGGWSGVTVITGGAETLVTATVSPAQVVANGTSTSTITITVKDSFGTPMPGVAAASIVVSATGTGHVITQPTAATNASGQTTASIRGTVADPSKRIHVTLDGVAFSEVATVVFTQGPANKLVFTAQPVGPYAAGTTINAIPVVTVQDAQGNTITASTAQITVAIGTNPGSGTLSGTKLRAAASGVATFSGLSINRAGVGYTLQATSPPLTAAVSNAFNIIPDALSARLVFAVSPGNSPALGVLSPVPQVAVQDALGNTVTTNNPVVTLAIKPGTGNASANLIGDNPVTATAGVATFNNVKITLAGTNYQLTATGTGVTGTPESQAFNVIAQPAMTVEKADDADPVDPNDNVTYTITYGNEGLDAGHNVVIRETLPAGMEFVSATNSGTHNAGVITWNVGTVAADTNGLEVTFVAHVTDALGDGGVVTNNNLTIVADGVQPVSQVTPETTTVTDGKAPQVSGQIPEPNSVSATRDAMIRFHVTDAGSGVDFEGDTVRILVEGDVIYDGSAETSPSKYDSTGEEQAVRGVTRRTGTPADYTFTFLPVTKFNHEQQVNVSVQVEDVSGNADTVNYSFHTQMRTFGTNAKVNGDPGAAIQDNPAVATDPNGNIWIVWDQRATATSHTDVYITKLPVDGNAFEPSVLIYTNSQFQSNPAIAADQAGKLYVAWEQWSAADPNHHIMMASSADGTTWVADPCTPPSRVNPSPAEPSTLVVARNPSIAITEANQVYIAWEETRNGADSDIWVRSFTQAGGFAAAIQLTANTANQTEPFVGIDPNGAAYVVWTDARNAATEGTDIYGARSDVGPWVAGPSTIANTAANQSHPVGATGDLLRLAWVDANDLKFGHLRADVLDPNEPGALPILPTLAAVPTDTNDRVFVAWVDSRNVVGTNSDTDIYLAEGNTDAYTTGDPLFGTNILVNDDTGVHRQTKPATGVDAVGDPYVVWVDNRNGNDDIFYSGSTAIKPPMATTVVPGSAGRVTVQSASVNNLQVQIPADALPPGIDANDVSMSEVSNAPEPPAGGFGMAYSFGPSGVVFDHPVTIRIPLADDAPVYSVYTVYRYDAGTGTWTQAGIHNPATKVTGAGGSYLEVQVDHFTTFIPSGVIVSGSGGGGGGCSLSPWSNAGPIEVILPFAAFVLVLLTCSIVGGLRRRSGGSRD